MNAIEILRAASRSVPNEDYVRFMAAVEAVEALVGAADAYLDCGRDVDNRFGSAASESLWKAVASVKGEQSRGICVSELTEIAVATEDKWPVKVHAVGCGQWAFVAGPRSGTGYQSKQAAKEAGDAARLAALARVGGA